MKSLFYHQVPACVLALALVLSFGTASFAESSFANNGMPPEMQGSGTGMPPDRPGGSMASPPDKPGSGMGGPGSSGVPSGYDAVKEYTSDTLENGQAYLSTGKDENAILVSSGTVQLQNAAVERTSSESTGGDSSSFYGVGAAILTTGGTLRISDSVITTDASGGAGIFAYGEGTAYVSDTSIHTQQNTSGGIHVAGGGTLYAWDLDVTTEGGSSAAIRSDRGSGTMVVDGGTYTSNGSGSPAIYSTADITVNDAVLTATGSEAVCIEGLNAIRLFDCDLSGSMPDQEQNDCTWTVIVYQSMSGDSEVGCGSFEMVGGSLTSTNGGLFYTTNTESTFLLQNVDITAAEDCEFFLKATGNSNERTWGKSGSNGAQCTFTAIDQTMNGDVIWDSISTLDLYLVGSSTLTGAFLQEESAAGDGGNGWGNLGLGEGSSWIVTGDSVLTNLVNNGIICDAEGNSVTICQADGTILVSGSSAYSIVVESYSEGTVDLSGASEADSWDNYAVDRF